MDMSGETCVCSRISWKPRCGQASFDGNRIRSPLCLCRSSGRSCSADVVALAYQVIRGCLHGWPRTPRCCLQRGTELLAGG